jgi:hypothetical protein
MLDTEIHGSLISGIDGCLEQGTVGDAESIGTPVGEHVLANRRVVVLAMRTTIAADQYKG